MNCRLCGRATVLLADRGDVSLHHCRSCGFTSGKPTEERSASERYRHYYDGPAPPAPAARYEEWLARAESEGRRGRLLEIGAGAGGFARAALRRGWIVDATEVSATGAEALRESGARIFVGDVANARYPNGTFDFVVALEVIEHLDQPGAHLREWARVVRPGGLLLITTPHWRGLSARVLGVRWRVVAPEHLGYFTRRTLSVAIEDAGFTDVNVRSRALDVFAWKRPRQSARPAPFDPARAALVRDRVDRDPLLHRAKELVHAALGVTGLGDTLLAWARK